MAKIGISVNSTTTRKVLKALSIFGGVQVITILCSIVRTKLVALWIGPAGVGLLALYNSTMEFLSTSTQLNLRQSAVRDLSQAKNDIDRQRLMAVARTLSFVLGFCGMVLVALFCSALSLWAFDDTKHWLAFVILSPMMLFSAIASGEWAIMQGFDKLKALARSSAFAALTATVAAIPLFYFLRLKAIVPVILVFAFANALYAMIFHVRTPGRRYTSLSTAFAQGHPMLSLGLYLTVSAAVTLLASNIFIVYLNRSFTAEITGLYQAGYTLVNTYVGMIFTAIAMEYYPRLASVAVHPRRCEVIVTHEIKIALWILLPVIVLFIVFKSLIVKILYAPTFEAILPYLSLAIIGVTFRAVSWCMAYVMLARGDGRIYIITEVASAVFYLALNIPLFGAMGFDGLGLAYIAWYAVYTAICYAVYRYRYHMRLRRGVWPLLLLVLAAGITTHFICSVFGF